MLDILFVLRDKTIFIARDDHAQQYPFDIEMQLVCNAKMDIERRRKNETHTEISQIESL